VAERRAHGRALENLARWLWTSGSAGAAIARTLLAPASLAYRMVHGVRTWLYDDGVLAIRSAAVPVISVGNLTVGGSGKTPFAAWLITRLLQQQRKPALLHGGYAGDEPELHRQWHPDVPVWAGRERVVSAREAVANGADVLVLDDGFQHRRLGRDADIVLVAAEQWSRRRLLLPAGPWREPASALQRANIIVITRKAASSEHAATVAREVQAFAGMTAPVAIAAILPSGWRTGRGTSAGPATGVAGLAAPPGEVVAVAGIARPDLFAANAAASGAHIVASFWFPDHHTYDRDDAGRITTGAGGRAIVTTAKDALKLEPLLPAGRLWVLEQDVHIERGAEALDAVVQRALS